jgi:hypothetical protein
MPLPDHFRSPVNDSHSWNEVHGQWPGAIVRNLFTILPTGEWWRRLLAGLDVFRQPGVSVCSAHCRG